MPTCAAAWHQRISRHARRGVTSSSSSGRWRARASVDLAPALQPAATNAASASPAAARSPASSRRAQVLGVVGEVGVVSPLTGGHDRRQRDIAEDGHGDLVAHHHFLDQHSRPYRARPRPLAMSPSPTTAQAPTLEPARAWRTGSPTFAIAACVAAGRHAREARGRLGDPPAWCGSAEHSALPSTPARQARRLASRTTPSRAAAVAVEDVERDRPCRRGSPRQGRMPSTACASTPRAAAPSNALPRLRDTALNWCRHQHYRAERRVVMRSGGTARLIARPVSSRASCWAAWLMSRRPSSAGRRRAARRAAPRAVPGRCRHHRSIRRRGSRAWRRRRDRRLAAG